MIMMKKMNVISLIYQWYDNSNEYYYNQNNDQIVITIMCS